ncbi:MAG TPA: hypothetical protein VJ963_03205, partial [Bacteroidales bacterium]|nr:hypothetical protein [Bacteroidales bacterium]
FIKEGGYEIREKGEKDRQYYRFRRPEDSEFPDQIEIFARNPDLLDLKEGSHLGPLPVPEDITSLSAILLDDDYYRYTIDHSRFTDALKIANIESLICLKARAFLDLTKRKETGETIPERKIRKHKLDIFRLATMLTADDNFILPANIKADMQSFIESIKDEMPGNEIFKEMGLGKVNVEELFDLIIKNYNLRK